MHVPLGKTAKKRLLRPQGNAFDASPDQNYDLRLGKHSFPRKNCIQLGKVERTLEKNQAIHDFQVLRRKTGHVVRSRSNTCEKISPGGKKELLSVFGSNTLKTKIGASMRDPNCWIGNFFHAREGLDTFLIIFA